MKCLILLAIMVASAILFNFASGIEFKTSDYGQSLFFCWFIWLTVTIVAYLEGNSEYFSIGLKKNERD